MEDVLTSQERAPQTEPASRLRVLGPHALNSRRYTWGHNVKGCCARPIANKFLTVPTLVPDLCVLPALRCGFAAVPRTKIPGRH